VRVGFVVVCVMTSPRGNGAVVCGAGIGCTYN
jgi:hypothetical protein